MPLGFSSSTGSSSVVVLPQGLDYAASHGALEPQIVGAARYSLSSRLIESFLHEARNPLNVLSINLDVLTQKLRGTAPNSDKYLRAMREQIQRVDGIMRDFADFISPEVNGAYDGHFSETLERAIRVAGHEFRRGKVRVADAIQPNLRVCGFSADAIYFVALQPILRAVIRSPAGSEVEIRASAEGPHVLFFVRDQGDETAEPFPFAAGALEIVCARRDAASQVQGREATISLPSA
jgi:signal transduction histidine kinase